jgi:hypothetical protein
MQIYCDWTINLVDILINLILIAMTTGITYCLFYALPKEKRKKALKERLLIFRNELIDFVLKREEKFKQSYELYEELAWVDEENDERYWHLIKINNWEDFFSDFRWMSTIIYIQFNDYWKGKELMFLINNLVMDDPKYLTLSTQLTELDSAINKTRTILGDKSKGIWNIETEDDLIKTKKDNQHIYFVVSSIEDVIECSKDVVETIDSILG